MVDFLTALSNTQNETFTENGALAYSTSSSPLVDLFSSIGALRSNSDSDIISRFKAAFAEDPTLALRIAFYARDVRGGLGERRVFQVIMHDLAFTHPSSVKQNLDNFAEFGRFSDLLCLLDTPLRRDVAFYLHDLYAADLAKLDSGSENISLVGKWLPSINTSSKATVQQAKLLCSIWGEPERTYRKNLARLRSAIQIIEDKLRKNDGVGRMQRVDRILENWDRLTEILEKAPDPEEVEAVLRSSGMPTRASEIGLSAEDAADAFVCSRDTRDKYLTSSLIWDIGYMDEFEAFLSDGFLRPSLAQPAARSVPSGPSSGVSSVYSF